MSRVNGLTTPIVYSMAFPLLLLDLWITLYQWACFPVYGVSRVPRHDYFVFDRYRLRYLGWNDRASCAYCSYANGVLGYAREIAARTEQYWCPIKHARAIADPHDHYQLFLDYGDAEGYRLGWPRLRAQLRPDRRRPVRGRALAHR